MAIRYRAAEARIAADAFIFQSQRGTLQETPMSQMPLFAGAHEAVLANDELGRIAYMPGLLPPEVAAAWFAELRESVTWQTQRRRMYDRDVDVPRLMAHFRLAPEEGRVPDVIRAAAGKVTAATGVPFNSVGLNFYRDGAAAAGAPRRSRGRQPAGHGLRDAAALHARDPEDQGAGRPADQPGLPREAGA